MANPWELPSDIDELIRRHAGAVHTATARRAGISLKRLQRLAADGRLTRLATGIYAPTAETADRPGGQPVVPGPEDWPSPHPLGIVLPAGWERELLESRRASVRMQPADGASAVAA